MPSAEANAKGNCLGFEPGSKEIACYSKSSVELITTGINGGGWRIEGIEKEAATIKWTHERGILPYLRMVCERDEGRQ